MSTTRTLQGLRDGTLPKSLIRRAREELSAPFYAARAKRVVKKGSSDSSPVDTFGGASDGYWRWLNTKGVTEIAGLSRFLPALPSEELQLTFTGSAGGATLREGWQGYLVFRALYEEHARALGHDTDVLDFGCGWGRIIRYFNRDVLPEHIHGADINTTVLDYCRESNPWATFHQVDDLPPTTFAAQSFDLIYAYSVFSHLSRTAHDEWLAEFTRIMRPGAVLIATTWPREFIERCAWLRTAPEAAELPASHRVSGGAFVDLDASLRAYDDGEFCFSYRNENDPEHFGEACVSEQFARANWPQELEIVEYLDDRSQAPQNVIVARRR